MHACSLNEQTKQSIRSFAERPANDNSKPSVIKTGSGKTMKACRTLTIVLALMGVIPATQADDYPSRPVHIIVGFGPGSAVDVGSRVVASRMSQSLGQQFVIENRPGAASSTGAAAAARAPKDGYTLYAGASVNVINAVLSSNLPFDFSRDFDPIALIYRAPLLLVVHSSLGVSSVQELIALGKSQPERIIFSSSGVGSALHLAGELFKMRTGLDLVHVPYQSSAQAMADLLAGRTTMMFAPASTVVAAIDEGKLKALASATDKRPGIAPNLPTMAEAGLADFDASVWTGFLAPSGTPPAVIDKLSRAVNEALKSEQVATLFKAQGFDAAGGTPEDVTRAIASDMKRWTDVATRAGMKK
jgi:tripartite-type tricarboxylate transporter receptor subunit TctC